MTCVVTTSGNTTTKLTCPLKFDFGTLTKGRAVGGVTASIGCHVFQYRYRFAIAKLFEPLLCRLDERVACELTVK